MSQIHDVGLLHHFHHRIRSGLADAGYLKGRYELIDGEILSKMGQNPPHSATIVFIAAWLGGLFSKLFVREQLPICIPGEQGAYAEPEPVHDMNLLFDWIHRSKCHPDDSQRRRNPLAVMLC